MAASRTGCMRRDTVAQFSASTKRQRAMRLGQSSTENTDTYIRQVDGLTHIAPFRRTYGINDRMLALPFGSQCWMWYSFSWVQAWLFPPVGNGLFWLKGTRYACIISSISLFWQGTLYTTLGLFRTSRAKLCNKEQQNFLNSL